jgi:Spy/CpxP family protein refolding chaperone
MNLSVSRTLRLALLMSLALNVALASMLAWQHGPWRGEARGRHAAAMSHLFDVRAMRRVIAPERQSALAPIFEKYRPQMRSRLEALFAARGDVRQAIAADPFDAAALAAAFARLREADRATAEQAQSMMAEVLAVATPEERRRMAEIMGRSASHGRAWRDRHARDRQGEP